MADSHSAENTKGQKTNDRKTNSRHTQDQDRAEIWPQRRLTKNYIKAKKHQNIRNMTNKKLIVLISHIEHT